MPVTQGDVTVTQLETASGTLVSLTHDTTLPRPRSLDFEIQGTKGIWQGEQRRIYLEGKSPHETWEQIPLTCKIRTPLLATVGRRSAAHRHAP